jgi:hypothetical protein
VIHSSAVDKPIESQTDISKAVREHLAAVSLPQPVEITIGTTHNSVAAAFLIDGVVETVEGCGESEAGLAEDVARQLRERLDER